MLVVVIDGG
jgi:hypothetical protein